MTQEQESGLVPDQATPSDPAKADRTTVHEGRQRVTFTEELPSGGATALVSRKLWWQRSWVFLLLVFVGAKLLAMMVGLLIVPNFELANSAMVPGAHTQWGKPDIGPCPTPGECTRVQYYGPYSMWFRWDSMHYVNQIEQPLMSPPMEGDKRLLEMERGAGRLLTESLERFAWAPLFMLLGKVLLPFTGDAMLAAFIVANVGFFGCLFFTYRLGRQIFGNDRDARWSVALLALLPGGFILQGVLSEPLFVCTSLATFYFATRKQWRLAALAAFLLGLSRSTGMTISLPLALLLLHQNKWVVWKLSSWVEVLKALPALLGGPLGWGLVVLWGHHIEGYWDLYNRVQANSWGVAMGNPVTQVQLYFEHGGAEAARAVLLLVLLGLVLLSAVRLPLAYVTWGAMLLVIPLSLEGPWVTSSLMRYTATVFPLSLAGVFLLRRWPALRVPLVVALTSVETGLFLLWQLDWTRSIV